MIKITWSNISRLNICTAEVACLLAHVLSNFEFDEHFEIQYTFFSLFSFNEHHLFPEMIIF